MSEGIKRKRDETATEYILRVRGIKDPKHFLNPRESDLLPLSDLKNIDRAVKIIIDGIKNNKRFSVFYDNDADGMTAGTLMREYLLNFMPVVNQIYSIGKGHGLKSINSEDIIETTDILVIVDSSTNDIEKQNYLKEHGVEIIIADHHEGKDNPNICIVNSQFNNYKNPQLSGSGVTWKLCLALDKAMNTNYAYQFCDLASVGIISDMCNIGEDYPENRYIVHHGLNNLNNQALKTLIGKYSFTANSIAYSIAPKINSAIRMDRNELVVEFLAEKDEKKCKKLLKELDQIRKDQNKLVDEVANDVEFQIKLQDDGNQKVIYAFINDVKLSGISGLVATKMSKEFSRPAIILHSKENKNVLSGSIRGIGIDNFKDIINETGLAESTGHQNAAGIEVKQDNFYEFINKINDALKDVEFKNEVQVDLQLEPEEIYLFFVEEIEKINRISGQGFKPINIFMENVEVNNLINMQDKHVKFVAPGGLTLIKWNSPELYNLLKCTEEGIYKTVDIIGDLQMSNFKGQKQPQIIISDYRNINEELDFLR